MPLKSDLVLPVSKFDPASQSEQAVNLNKQLIARCEKGPQWFEVGPQQYREMRWAGKTAFPAPVPLPQGIDISIPSREAGRGIPCRLFYPEVRKDEAERKKCAGVVMHFHGGGWVLGDHKQQDDLLQFYANAGDLAVLSIGYRHAPEDPFPKGPEDCFDAGDYFLANAEKEYGGPVQFIGGESAGGHLSLLTTFYLLKKYPDFKLSGLLLHYGAYDLSELPSTKHFTKPLVLSQEIMAHFFDAFLPNHTVAQRKDPSVSPLYEDLVPFRGRLPSALFTIGTEDPLVDDSVMMASRWMIAGGDAILKVYSGAPHAFNRFPKQASNEAGECADDTEMYIKERLRKA